MLIFMLVKPGHGASFPPPPNPSISRGAQAVADHPRQSHQQHDIQYHGAATEPPRALAAGWIKGIAIPTASVAGGTEAAPMIMGHLPSESGPWAHWIYIGYELDLNQNHAPLLTTAVCFNQAVGLHRLSRHPMGASRQQPGL